SMMRATGLSKYCLDINGLQGDALIERFRDLERIADTLKSLLTQKVREFRKELDEKYQSSFNGKVTGPSGVVERRALPVASAVPRRREGNAPLSCAGASGLRPRL